MTRADCEEYFLFARGADSRNAKWLPLGMLLTQPGADVSMAVAQRAKELRVYSRARHGACAPARACGELRRNVR